MLAKRPPGAGSDKGFMELLDRKSGTWIKFFDRNPARYIVGCAGTDVGIYGGRKIEWIAER